MQIYKMHVRASSRVQALDCAAPAGPSDFAAGLIRLSLSLMGKLTMNTSSSHTMSSPAGAAPVPPTWLFVLLAAGVLVWPLVEAAKNILCLLLVLGSSWRYGRYWHLRSWGAQQWLIVVTLVVLGLASFLYPPAARGEWLDYFRYFAVFWVVLTLPWTERQIRILWLVLGASLVVGLADAVWQYFYLGQRRFFPELHAVGHVHPSSMYIGTAAVALATASFVLSGKQRWFLMTGALACWFSLLFGEGRGNFVGGLAAILVCMVLGYHHYRRQVAVALLLLVATIALAVASNARIVQKKKTPTPSGGARLCSVSDPVKWARSAHRGSAPCVKL